MAAWLLIFKLCKWPKCFCNFIYLYILPLIKKIEQLSWKRCKSKMHLLFAQRHIKKQNIRIQKMKKMLAESLFSWYFFPFLVRPRQNSHQKIIVGADLLCKAVSFPAQLSILDLENPLPYLHKRKSRESTENRVIKILNSAKKTCTQVAVATA